ncbi:MAG: hypothetical protein Solivirus4_21 [Solivirus sp.]|uniref:Transmembrane protein n=1 Tax=Solivirus sp. TaxID=2487772 RepID=A0A3G5AFU6_9VIRU|nr:MAG: hypothetical protein Solivirus4_21 [Solivirus sp.]
MSTENYSVGGLRESLQAKKMHRKDGCMDGSSCCRLLIAFLALWLLIAIILIVARPRFLECGRRGEDRHDDRSEDDCGDGFWGRVNWGRLAGYSFVLAVVIAVFLYIVCCCGVFSACGAW